MEPSPQKRSKRLSARRAFPWIIGGVAATLGLALPLAARRMDDASLADLSVFKAFFQASPFQASPAQDPAWGPLAAPPIDAPPRIAPPVFPPAPVHGLSLDPPAESVYSSAPLTNYYQTVVDPLSRVGVDAAGLREALEAYKSGDLERGDAAAAEIRDPIAALAAEWAALRFNAGDAGYARIQSFIAAHPDWPGADWLKQASEEQLFAMRNAPETALAYFNDRAPETAAGRIALARAYLSVGKVEEAQDLARQAWRMDLSPALENAVLKQLGEYLRPQDHKQRADRLLYKGQDAAALRAAALSGPDALALARVRAAVNQKAADEKRLQSVPFVYADDPGWLFSRIQWLRERKRYAEAVALLLQAPTGPEAIDGDAWWEERRFFARKSLDAGDAKTAYVLCARRAPASAENNIDAEFHAGWIALRFLNEPLTAAAHFDAAAQAARTPASRARANYWRGRAAEALGTPAEDYYLKAGAESSNYYGQLARLRLGATGAPIRYAQTQAQGADRIDVVRVVEAYYAAGMKTLATQLAMIAAKKIERPEQMSALAAVVVRDRDAKISSSLGKIATQRGYPMDDLAFPLHGVPSFAPFANSAPLPIVYSIARQESVFDPKAVSSAGALGLMQMIPSTAKHTADKVMTAFDARRLTEDPVYNAQLGAAHLGELLEKENNSLILTFAAYNAGPGRVREWIALHGDPRAPHIDPVDWVEWIPNNETRNYVQRVLENVTLYRARLSPQDAEPAGHLRMLARG